MSRTECCVPRNDTNCGSIAHSNFHFQPVGVFPSDDLVLDLNRARCLGSSLGLILK